MEQIRFCLLNYLLLLAEYQFITGKKQEENPPYRSAYF
jgi:hypothetical protein